MKEEVNYTILLIDDNKIDNFVTQKILEKTWKSSRFIVAASAKEGLSILESNMENLDNIPDLIFLDINMPALNGFDFLSLFEKFDDPVKKKCKIVVLTSSEKEEDMNDMMQNKLVRHYISKPLSEEALLKLKDNLTA